MHNAQVLGKQFKCPESKECYIDSCRPKEQELLTGWIKNGDDSVKKQTSNEETHIFLHVYY
jgi:hypothetical protein